MVAVRAVVVELVNLNWFPVALPLTEVFNDVEKPCCTPG